jgi:AraC-like DNA-binding protein
LHDINEMAGSFASSRLTLHGVFHAVLPPHSSFHPYTVQHPTPSSGFVFVNNGTGEFVFDGTSYNLQVGIIVHGGKNMTLTMNTGRSELEYFLVRYSIQEEQTNDVKPNAAFFNEHFAMKPGGSPQLTELLRQLHESFYTPGNMALLRSSYLFKAFLHEMFSSCLNQLQGKSRETVERARAYIHSHYMEPLSLQSLSAFCKLNSKAFSYLFHKYTGVTPIQYLIQYRMKRAEELLNTSSFSIKQVALSVGYDDALYFSRLYKKHYGYAPSQSPRD